MSSQKIVSELLEKCREVTDSRVESGIEKNRKGDAVIKVTDSSGKPVPDAHIKIKQTSHDFKYGANLFLLDELPTDEENQKYREFFSQTFNLATVPFYWGDLEPEQGRPRYRADSPKVYRRPAPDLCVDFCEKNGIEPKAHCLVYDKFSPDWLPDDVKEIKKLYEKRFRELADRYAKRIPSWEVINETLQCWLNEECNVMPDGKTPLFLEHDLLDWAFALAKQYFPDNELIINDGNLFLKKQYRSFRSNYYLQIEGLLQRGAKIDKIGMQHHNFSGVHGETITEKEIAEQCEQFYNPYVMYLFLDLYETLQKPLQFTEITVPTYADNEEEEQVQAELIRHLYSMWFSHGAVDSIVYWNTVDQRAFESPNWNENLCRGGLLHKDLSVKPSGKMIQWLFGEHWRTNAALQTDETGKAGIRGFYGKYDIEVNAGGKRLKTEIHIQKGKDNCFSIQLM